MHRPTLSRAAAWLPLATLSACLHADPGVRPAFFTDQVAYLEAAHSHNNYDQPRPLADAIERGFASIEIDVALLDGELYVAHGVEEVDARATLRTLYLDPLRDLVTRKGATVYGPSRPPLQLLVDVKTDADSTYAVLHDVLGEYADLLTVWADGEERPGAVSVIISGNRAIDLIRRQSHRYATIDGRVLDDRSTMTAQVMPLVSEDWERLGPPVRQARLASARRVVEQMHAEGRKVRFWATPEDEEVWNALVAMGVDYIGTDDVRRLERFLRNRSGADGQAVD